MTISDRYSRQILFHGIGSEGQQKIANSKVLVVGMGALGTVIANSLCRAGVGYLRLVDRDYVELSNLQRQTIYDEQDVENNLPKAAAAVRHLQKVNSEIVLEPVVSDVNSGNIEYLIDGMDLILDGTDNFETRFLINDACIKHNIPWIYGGAIGSTGMSMNIIPGKTACFRCLVSEPRTPSSSPTCSSMGVLGMLTGIIGCLESAEALKILIGSSKICTNLCVVDIWENTINYINIPKSPECPTCGQGCYDFLNSMKGSYTSSLCGRDSIQVIPSKMGNMDFPALSNKLSPLGSVKYNQYILNFAVNNIEITLFKDGRAIIKNVKDEGAAKSVYSEYIGL